MIEEWERGNNSHCRPFSFVSTLLLYIRSFVVKFSAKKQRSVVREKFESESMTRWIDALKENSTVLRRSIVSETHDRRELCLLAFSSDLVK